MGHDLWARSQGSGIFIVDTQRRALMNSHSEISSSLTLRLSFRIRLQGPGCTSLWQAPCSFELARRFFSIDLAE